MAAGNYDGFIIERGSAWSARMEFFTDEAETTHLDISTATITGGLCVNLNQDMADAVFTFAKPSAGVLDLSLTQAQVDGIKFDESPDGVRKVTKVLWDVFIDFGSGKVKEMQGTATVIPASPTA